MQFLTRTAEKLKMRMPIRRRIVVDFKRNDSFHYKKYPKGDSFLQAPEEDSEDTNSQNAEDDNNADMLDTLEYEIENKTVHNLDDDDGSFSTKRHKIPIVSDILSYINQIIKKIQEPMYINNHHKEHFEFSAVYERYKSNII